MFDLSGRVAVVTGGNGGIGLGMARGLARAGADIAIWARNGDKNADAKRELEALGNRVLALRCDVSSEADISAAMAETLETLGQVDVCVANAGYGAPGDPLKLTLKRHREQPRPLEPGELQVVRIGRRLVVVFDVAGMNEKVRVEV